MLSAGARMADSLPRDLACRAIAPYQPVARAR